MSLSTVENLLAGRPLHTVSGSHTIAAACHRMRECGVGALAVVEGTRLVGILSERDVAVRVVAGHRDPMLTLVREVMTPSPLTVAATSDAVTALEAMLRGGCRHLPVMRGDTPVGMLSIRDISFATRLGVRYAGTSVPVPALG